MPPNHFPTACLLSSSQHLSWHAAPPNSSTHASHFPSIQQTCSLPPQSPPPQSTHSTTLSGADYLPIRSWHHVLPQAIPPCPREGLQGLLVPSWRLRRACSPPPPQVPLAHSGCPSLEPAAIHIAPSDPQFPPCVSISAGLSNACTQPLHARKPAPVPMLRAAHRQVPEPHAEAWRGSTHVPPSLQRAEPQAPGSFLPMHRLLGAWSRARGDRNTRANWWGGGEGGGGRPGVGGWVLGNTAAVSRTDVL